MHAIRSNYTPAVLLAAGTFLSLACGPMQTGFRLVEDFDDLGLGNIDGRDGWIAAGDSSRVAIDPADAKNHVLEVTAESATVHRALFSQGDGTFRTLFFRLRFTSQLNCSFGLSDMPAPEQFHDFEPELGLSNATGELRIRDGNEYDVLARLAPNTWYNVWMLIDGTDETTQVYLHARASDAAGAGDLQDADGQTVFAFRNGTDSALLTYFIKNGGGNSANTGPLYLDDIYVDDAETANLSNPTRSPVPVD